MSPRTKTVSILILIVAVTALVVAGLSATAPEPAPERRAQPPARVDATAAVRADLAPAEQVSGRLAPRRRSKLRFELAGQVAERVVEAGTTVRQGDLLLRLADGDFRDAVAEAEAQLVIEREAVARDRRLLALAREHRDLQAREVRRLEKLDAGSLVSRSRLDEVQQQLVQLQGEVARLENSVQSADARLQLRHTALERTRRNLERTRLQAPFDGVVNQVLVQQGDYVSPSQDAVEVVDVEELELSLQTRAAVAQALELGDGVRVRGPGGDWVQGRVVALQRDPDVSTFTHAVRIRIPGGAGASGQVATAELPLTPLHDVVTVPAAGVVYEDGKAYVFVVEDGRLRRAPVQLGARVGAMQVVRSGVQAGEQVVARDAAALSDGQAVVVERDTAAAPEKPDA